MIHRVMVDASRFPHLSRYLSRLPAGVDSYPECEAKGSMVRSALDGHDLRPDIDGLPSALADLITTPPPATRWVPLVHAESIFHAVCDRFYETEDDVHAWTRERTLAMGNSKLYRKLLGVAGPAMLLKMAAKIHRVFERGTELTVSIDGSTARVEMRHPSHVHSPLNQRTNVAMLCAVIEITGGTDADCRMTRARPDCAVFECSWRD